MTDEFDEEENEMQYEDAQCCRCDLDLDSRSGYCPNHRCPYHNRFQDEVVRWLPPDEIEERYIEQMRPTPRSGT